MYQCIVMYMSVNLSDIYANLLMIHRYIVLVFLAFRY